MMTIKHEVLEKIQQISAPECYAKSKANFPIFVNRSSNFPSSGVVERKTKFRSFLAPTARRLLRRKSKIIDHTHSICAIVFKEFSCSISRSVREAKASHSLMRELEMLTG